jgi:hypothetical protein
VPASKRSLVLVVLLASFACKSGPCPPDTELLGSQKTTQQSCSYQDSNGRVVRHGPFTEWYVNGQKSNEGTYEHGKQVGLWMYWDESGRKTAERIYKDGEIASEKKF